MQRHKCRVFCYLIYCSEEFHLGVLARLPDFTVPQREEISLRQNFTIIEESLI